SATYSSFASLSAAFVRTAKLLLSRSPISRSTARAEADSTGFNRSWKKARARSPARMRRQTPRYALAASAPARSSHRAAIFWPLSSLTLSWSSWATRVTSQTSDVRSLLPEASNLPSPEKAMELIPSWWPVKRRTLSPVANSQRWISSTLPQARNLPSGEKLTAPPPVSLSMRSDLPVRTDQIRIRPRLPTASREPSEENATD